MPKLLLKLDHLTGFLSCLFADKRPNVTGSLFAHYAQKISFFACLLYSGIVVLVFHKAATTWPIFLSYIALVTIVTEGVFIAILNIFGRQGLPRELAENMSVPAAFTFIFLALVFLAVGFFSHQYLFIGTMYKSAFGLLVLSFLMAVISSIIYPLCLAHIQMGVMRLCLIGKEKSL